MRHTRRLWWWRLAVIAVVAALASSITVTAALAADLMGNARFTSPGARIYDDGAVSYGCTLFGFCDGATHAALAHDAVTRKRSDRTGEPVVALCTVNDLIRVRTFAATGGDEVLTGWVARTALTDTPQLGPC